MSPSTIHGCGCDSSNNCFNAYKPPIIPSAAWVKVKVFLQTVQNKLKVLRQRFKNPVIGITGIIPISSNLDRVDPDVVFVDAVVDTVVDVVVDIESLWY